MTVRRKELEDAVCNVIQIIKQIPELSSARLAVIGDLALWHYRPRYRPANNINFIINLPALEFLRKKLLRHPNSPFWKDKQALFYRSPAGRDIEIKFSPQWLFPDLPISTQQVFEIPYGEVPYIPVVELFILKLTSMSTTTNLAKRRQDSDDAFALVSIVDNSRLDDEDILVPTTKKRLERKQPRRLKGAKNATARSVIMLSPEQEQLIKDALRCEDLTVSSVMHSPPLEL
ncbi:hypothetical protein GGR51DRAFT_577512 [Nemania sp. FL0031]|nr:hypothetical protein GGR51DRAFT_577512 [Nemania sp. FL0031]